MKNLDKTKLSGLLRMTYRPCSILLMLMSFLFRPSFAQNSYNAEHLEGEIYVRIENSFPLEFSGDGPELNMEQFSFSEEFIREYEITDIRGTFYFAKSDSIRRILRMRFNKTEKTSDLIEILSQMPFIRYAERIPVDRIFYTPNDLGTNNNGAQWSLYKINAQAAWDLVRGNPAIVVAVVDNAVDINHFELAGTVVPGWNPVAGTPNTVPPADSFNHGTHVAGIAGANTDNAGGVASIGFGISIMPITCTCTSPPFLNICNGYEGITWASQNGAHIINCSWGSVGSTQWSQANQSVITNAVDLYGCIIVASAGNHGNNTVAYPAAYNNVIAVANTQIDDTKASSSAFGSWVDISAPGTQINSCITDLVDGNAMGSKSGTSMASPLVAGLMGLVWSVAPDILDREDVLHCIASGVDDISAQNTVFIGQLGVGRINAYKACLCASACGNDIHVTQSISSGSAKYETSANIAAANIVSGTANVVYDAGVAIKLQTGFKVTAGANFNAYIDGCSGR